MIRGAIFDMDGVLLDNLDFHLQAFKDFGKEQGRNFTDDQIQSVFGRKNSDMLRVLLDKTLTAEEVDRHEARKEALYRELIRPHLQETVVRGLLEFVEALRGSDFGIALATSGPVENVEMVLEGLRLQHDFDFLVTGEQVERGKPHPEAFLRASKGLNLPASECVVFEDSFSGIEAALRASCKCVALATTHSQRELRAVSPHRIIRNFSEIETDQLQDL